MQLDQKALAESLDDISRMDFMPYAYRGILRAAAEVLAALKPQEPGKWQDISTAPKDGKEFNAYRSDQGVFTCRWALMVEFIPKDANGDPAEEYDEEFACWWHDGWGWMEGDETPTHWMPLPAPPSLPTTAGGGHDT